MLKKTKNYFIPHKDNDYAPHILQQGAMLGMVGLILLSFLVANFQALLWQESGWLVGAILPAVVTEDTNHERTNLALKPLTRNVVLDKAAQMKAEDMANNSYFAHYSPRGISPWHWFDEVGYLYTHAGENLAVHFSDSDEVVEAWMNSPTHRANIVNSNYTEIGIGTARGVYNGYNTVFVVQLFGAPAMKSLLPQLPKHLSIENNVTEIGGSVATDTIALPMDIGSSSEIVLGVEVAGLTPTTSASMPEEIVTGDNVSLPVTEVPSHETKTPASSSPYISIEDSRVSVYLDSISTSTNLLPLPKSSILAGSSTATTSPVIGRLATQPHYILQLLYIILGTIIASGLLLSVMIEWRRQQLIQVSYGVLLLLLMSGLFYLHVVVSTGVVIV